MFFRMPSTRSKALKEKLAEATTRGQKQQGRAIMEKSIGAENSPHKVIGRYGNYSCLTRVTLWEVSGLLEVLKTVKAKINIKLSFLSSRGWQIKIILEVIFASGPLAGKENVKKWPEDQSKKR